jgi:hypothetical protein
MHLSNLNPVTNLDIPYISGRVAYTDRNKGYAHELLNNLIVFVTF